MGDRHVALAEEAQIGVAEPDAVGGKDTGLEDTEVGEKRRDGLPPLEVVALLPGLGDVDVQERVALARRFRDVSTPSRGSA